MKVLKKVIKYLIGIIGLLIIASYIFDYDYILKGVRVVYFTGHVTAFIDDILKMTPLKKEQKPMLGHYTKITTRPMLQID